MCFSKRFSAYVCARTYILLLTQPSIPCFAPYSVSHLTLLPLQSLYRLYFNPTASEYAREAAVIRARRKAGPPHCLYVLL